VIVFGGTEICDDVKYARDPARLWACFADVDLIVPGEGESPLVDILCAIRDGEPFDGLSGVLARGAGAVATRLNYEHVGRLPAPRYDVWDWDAYWSPEPVVLYSPTRGCYWNKCTFCDYGLNSDRPTSPSRERPVETVVEDLRSIAAFARTLYFSVDAMSPRYLNALSTALAEADLGLSWSAELRLERTIPKRGTAQLLRRAGCVAISFGYESASQRVLDLIDKGVNIADVPEILRQLAEAGIGAQMMGFTGFPSETAAEASATYEFLLRYQELWALAGVGEFALTPGAIVARQPERFGVEVLPALESHDIIRTLGWRDRRAGDRHRAGSEGEGVDPALRAALRRTATGRPFVGGIDSSHTLLYFARFGKGLLPAEPDSGNADHGPVLARQQIADAPFVDVDVLTTVGDLTAAHARMLHDGGVTYRDLARWLAEPGRGRPGSTVALVSAGGVVSDAGIGGQGLDTGKLQQCLELLRLPASPPAAGADAESARTVAGAML